MGMNAVKLGLLLVVLGVALAFVSVLVPLIMAALSSVNAGASVSGGGCIVVLFIPICFGVGELALPLIMVSMVMALALIVVSAVLLRSAMESAGIAGPGARASRYQISS